ncbi:MAG TPA: hypothetical protein DIU19_12975 [Alcanivorax sp.]|nr:hypothetical protein [Alcanivorax sp.]
MSPAPHHGEGPIVVAALYRFTRLDDYQSLREPLLAAMLERDVRGTLLLAHEGINGTISGARDDVDAIVGWLRADPRFQDMEYKESFAAEHPFLRTKVKLKKEIVTMGVEDLDPNANRGTYLEAEEWNRVIADPETLVIDTRNDYEYEVGTFQGAVNPNTKAFREFPEYVKQHLDPARHKKVAMFCTGGIRCEKASAYMLSKGFESVFHLKGGILQYLEDVPQEDSRWEGDCYVFDGRVAVGHGLARTDWTACYGCGQPLSPEERADPAFEEGVSCAHCIDRLTEEKAASLRDRQRQIMRETGRG